MYAVLPVLLLNYGVLGLIEHSEEHCVFMTPIIWLLNSLHTDRAKYIDLLIVTYYQQYD